MGRPSPSRMTKREIVDKYFIENRTRLIELAAYLDRIDRAAGPAVAADFRVRALRRGLERLLEPGERTAAIQMLLSDLDVTLRDALDQKSADGAPKRGMEAMP